MAHATPSSQALTPITESLAKAISTANHVQSQDRAAVIIPYRAFEYPTRQGIAQDMAHIEAVLPANQMLQKYAAELDIS